MSKTRIPDVTTIPDPSKYPGQSTHSQAVLLPDGDGGGVGSVVGRRRPNGGAAVPSASNTGALGADASQAAHTLSYPDGFAAAPTLDWLEFTVHVPHETGEAPVGKQKPSLHRGEKPLESSDVLLSIKSAIVKYFGGGETLPFGKYFYKESAQVLGTGRVLWNVDRPEMGVHVILPSSALNAWSQNTKKDVVSFLHHVSSRGAKFTRVDIAIDTNKVSMESLVDAYEQRCIVSKLQDEQLIDGRKAGKPSGKTLYVGSRKSGRRMVRFYDKAAQQEVAGTWTRCEVEFRSEHAQTAVDYLLAGHNPNELILSTVDFRDNDNAEVHRRTPLQWWRDWVGNVQKLDFPVRKTEVVYENTMAWFTQQVAPTLAWLMTYNGNWRWLENEVMGAAARVPAWKWDMLPKSQGVHCEH